MAVQRRLLQSLTEPGAAAGMTRFSGGLDVLDRWVAFWRWHVSTNPISSRPRALRRPPARGRRTRQGNEAPRGRVCIWGCPRGHSCGPRSVAVHARRRCAALRV